MSAITAITSPPPPAIFSPFVANKALPQIHPCATLGWPLGGPCVALGWPKGDPSPTPIGRGLILPCFWFCFGQLPIANCYLLFHYQTCGPQAPSPATVTEEPQHSVNQYSVVKDRTRYRRGLLGGIFEGKEPAFEITATSAIPAASAALQGKVYRILFANARGIDTPETCGPRMRDSVVGQFEINFTHY